MFDWLLWIAIIVLILLPPSLDPAIRIKMGQVIRGEHYESPSCFGGYLGGNIQAERDCGRCPCLDNCLKASGREPCDTCQHLDRNTGLTYQNPECTWCDRTYSNYARKTT